MKKSSHWLLYVVLVPSLLLAPLALAEKAPYGPDELRAKATHILTGEVRAVYSRQVVDDIRGAGGTQGHTPVGEEAEEMRSLTGIDGYRVLRQA